MVEGRRRCVIAPPSALRAATSRSLRGTEDQVGNLPPAGRARARCADGADIAEDILEEAAFAAERRRLVAFGADLADQLEPGAIDRGDIDRLRDTDAPNLLVYRALPRAGASGRTSGRESSG